MFVYQIVCVHTMFEKENYWKVVLRDEYGGKN